MTVPKGGRLRYVPPTKRLPEALKSVRHLRSDILGIYEVKPGDTLSKIAKNFLGDANRYQAIFELNTDQLKDPNKIQVGQKLKIPVM